MTLPSAARRVLLAVLLGAVVPTRVLGQVVPEPTAQQLQHIESQKLGLRVGDDTDGAAYSLSDFGDGDLLEQVRWTMDPSTAPALSSLWKDRLANTVRFIAHLTRAEERESFSLLIVSKADGVAERYSVEGGAGDGKTFKKKNKLPPGASVVARAKFTVGETQAVIDWIVMQTTPVEN